ncbi:YciI family protein [Sphingobium algorifonticola]|uniref:YciI family protein n=1 Tax=Sphingobium algorifonticola TaxID=2008318 RepID=A0A437JCX0_9SPHN|nr:YciI family protein [Sphingobium algorifonticola]RVT43600.1 YciI family protein [Sphingobium algorifonticola]
MAHRYLGLLLSALLAGAGSAAQARDFTLMIYERPQDLALRDDRGEAGRRYWGDYAAFGAALAQAGVMKGGAALDDPSPVAAGDDAPRLSGYFIIDVADHAAAETWARRISAAATGRVVVRPHIAMPGTK